MLAACKTLASNGAQNQAAWVSFGSFMVPKHRYEDNQGPKKLISCFAATAVLTGIYTPPTRHRRDPSKVNEPTNLLATPLDLVPLRQFFRQRLLALLELPLRLQAHDAAAPGVARHVVVHGLEGGLQLVQ